ncbi:MAG: AAA family ATPase [Lachnospiraceae bacterium]|nr:AAA family ATPase [Lachnospiraceae bacterium]
MDKIILNTEKGTVKRMDKITISKAKETVKTGIRGYLLKDDKGNYLMEEKDRLPFYLEGMPGVGKTQIVGEIAEELKIGFVSFSLTHHTRNTVLGLPVIETMDNGDKYTRYTMSEIIESVLEKVNEGFSEGILLLDEFPCMAESIMPVMLSFLQNKNIGRHFLPEGWVIILCGNPPQYNKASRKFDAAVLDRIRKIEIEYSTEDFIKYAKEKDLNRTVIDYLELYPGNLYCCNVKDGNLELVTCRGWENMSHMLKIYEEMKECPDIGVVEQYIKSGEIAANFYGYYIKYFPGFSKSLFQKIISNKYGEDEMRILEKQDIRGQWQLISYVMQYIGTRHKGVKDGTKGQLKLADETGNLIEYLNKCNCKETVMAKLLELIKDNKDILLAFARNRNAAYLELCKKMYKGEVA